MKTLEQAAIDCFGKSGSMCSARMGFIEGALWQKKQSALNAYDIAEIYAAIQAKMMLYNPKETRFDVEMQIYEEVAREYNKKRDYEK